MITSFSFLAIWPGSFLYHLITLLIIEAGLGLAWDMYRRTEGRAGYSFGVCFAGLLLGRLFYTLISLLPVTLLFNAVLAELLNHLITFGATLLIIWAFVLTDFFQSPQRWQRYFFPAQVIGGLGLALMMPFWQVVMSLENSLILQTALWQLWQLLLLGAAIGVAMYRQRSQMSITLAIALAAFLLGHLLRLAFPFSFVIGLGLERFGELIGYPLLLIVIYQHIFQYLPSKPAHEPAKQVVNNHAKQVIDLSTHQKEIQTYKDELQAISQEAIDRHQEMIFLLETSQAVNSSLELQVVLQQTVQYIALAIRADAAVIALRQTDDPGILKVVAGYDPRSKEVWELSQIQLTIDRYPTLKKAMECGGEPLIIQNSEPSAELLTLHAALGSSDIGPLLIQSFCHREESLGVLMLGNARQQNLFSDGDTWLCQSMADQVSGAIVNARLYDEVTSLLTQRQTEVSQRQAILDSVTDGVIVVDNADNVLMVNPAATKILKRSEKNIVDRPLAEVCPPLAETDYVMFEMDDLIISAYHSPVYLPDQTLLGKVAVLRDVTSERQAERAKSQFIETVSHELRTPVTSIKGYADLLLNGAVQPGSDHYRRFVNTIKTNTERLIVIVNNMIAVSEMDGKRSLMLQSVDINEVIDDVLTAIQPELEQRDLGLDKQFETDLPRLTADPLRLRQVFGNLLSNAMKYTYPGGKITISTGMIPPEESEGQGYIKASIVDTGVGIPPDEQERIFDKFYRAENPLQIEAGGPGVGLTVVRDIVEQHGGYLWLHSVVSQGSQFNVVLPIAGPKKMNKQPTASPELAQAEKLFNGF